MLGWSCRYTGAATRISRVPSRRRCPSWPHSFPGFHEIAAGWIFRRRPISAYRNGLSRGTTVCSPSMAQQGRERRPRTEQRSVRPYREDVSTWPPSNLKRDRSHEDTGKSVARKLRASGSNSRPCSTGSGTAIRNPLVWTPWSSYVKALSTTGARESARAPATSKSRASGARDTPFAVLVQRDPASPALGRDYPRGSMLSCGYQQARGSSECLS